MEDRPTWLEIFSESCDELQHVHELCRLKTQLGTAL